MAAPRSPAARAAAGPSCSLAFRWSSSRSARFLVSYGSGHGPLSADAAAHAVIASAGRPVAAHRWPQQSRLTRTMGRSPVCMPIWSSSRRCAVASSMRLARKSRNTLFQSWPLRFVRSPTFRDEASQAAQACSAPARSPVSIMIIVTNWLRARVRRRYHGQVMDTQRGGHRGRRRGTARAFIRPAAVPAAPCERYHQARSHPTNHLCHRSDVNRIGTFANSSVEGGGRSEKPRFVRNH